MVFCKMNKRFIILYREDFSKISKWWQNKRPNKKCQKIIFFILVGGAPGTIWDHTKPKNGRKKGPKNSPKRAKIGQDRPRWGPSGLTFYEGDVFHINVTSDTNGASPYNFSQSWSASEGVEPEPKRTGTGTRRTEAEPNQPKMKINRPPSSNFVPGWPPPVFEI